MIQELLPILQAKNSPLLQQQTDSTRSVSSDRPANQPTTEAAILEPVPEVEEIEESTFSEIKIHSAPPSQIHVQPSSSSFQVLNSSSVMIQTSPLESPRYAKEPSSSKSIPVVVVEEKKMQKKMQLEDGATQTDKMQSPRNHQKKISAKLLENEIRKLKLNEKNTLRTSSPTSKKKKKKNSASSKRTTSSKEEIVMEDRTLRKLHQVVTPYNTSPRQLELLAKVHTIQKNIHAAKRKEERKKLGYDEDEAMQRSHKAPKPIQNVPTMTVRPAPVVQDVTKQEISKEEQKFPTKPTEPSAPKETKPVEVRPTESVMAASQAVSTQPEPPKPEPESKNSSFEEYDESFEDPIPETHEHPSSTSSSSPSESESSSEEEQESSEEESEEDSSAASENEIDEEIEEEESDSNGGNESVEEEIIISDDDNDYVLDENWS